MSHLITKVATKAPNVSGAVDVKLNDFTNVGAFADTQTLVYDSASQTWSGAVVPTPKERVAVFGRGESQDYALSGLTVENGASVGFYDTSPINNVPTLVTFNKQAGTDWLESVTLQAGKYELFAQSSFTFSALGYVAYRWVNASNAWYSNLGVIGETTTYGGSTTYATGFLSISVATTFYVKIYAATNASTSQGVWPSVRGMISIRELS